MWLGRPFPLGSEMLGFFTTAVEEDEKEDIVLI